MHPDWARSLRDQCAAAGVPFLFKQWGEWGAPTDDLNRLDWPYHPHYDRTHWFDARTCARPAAAGWSDKYHGGDRKSVGEGKRVSVRVDFGGRRIIKKKTTRKTN